MLNGSSVVAGFEEIGGSKTLCQVSSDGHKS